MRAAGRANWQVEVCKGAGGFVGAKVAAAGGAAPCPMRRRPAAGPRAPGRPRRARLPAQVGAEPFEESVLGGLKSILMVPPPNCAQELRHCGARGSPRGKRARGRRGGRKSPWAGQVRFGRSAAVKAGKRPRHDASVRSAQKQAQTQHAHTLAHTSGQQSGFAVNPPCARPPPRGTCARGAVRGAPPRPRQKLPDIAHPRGAGPTQARGCRGVPWRCTGARMGAPRLPSCRAAPQGGARRGRGEGRGA
ncbi:MAG: hypothetical protein J3K34DRAFT_431785 [Monoraphidium minutum]|nr:MAG: hypothetical protein J3K34DRAFT_431785 [Monoraphidium minutum]